MESSSAVAKKAGTPDLPNEHGTYRYRFGRLTPWQGNSGQETYVLGDKLGWDILRRQTAGNLFNFQKKMEMPVHVIHALRNPFDIIGSWYTGGRRYEKFRRDPNGLMKLCDRYLGLAEDVNRIYYQSKFPKEQILQVRNEELCAKPKIVLREICDFLGLDSMDDYLEKATGKVFPQARRKSERVDQWPLEVVSYVDNEIIAKYPWLTGYTLQGDF